MAIQIKTIDVLDLALMGRDLMARNWAETGFDHEFSPDVARYEALQGSGVLFAKAAWLDSELIGYCTAIVTPHIHNRNLIVCAHDALYVDKPHRGGTAGFRLIREVEREAKFRGADRMLWHTRAGTNLADVLIKRGYVPADVVVMRGL